FDSEGRERRIAEAMTGMEAARTGIQNEIDQVSARYSDDLEINFIDPGEGLAQWKRENEAAAEIERERTARLKEMQAALRELWGDQNKAAAAAKAQAEADKAAARAAAERVKASENLRDLAASVYAAPDQFTVLSVALEEAE